MESALFSLANSFIRKANQSGQSDMTPMKLLKLVFIANGWHMAIFDKPMFLEEAQAWRYGPVIPELYQAIKSYRSSPVTHEIACQEVDFDEKSKRVIDFVWDKYAQYGGLHLSSLTHKEGSPWHQVWNAPEPWWDKTIPSRMIADYYRNLIAVPSVER